MALWDRVSRLLSSFTQERLDERMLVGVRGEEYATEVIASANPQCHVPNAIVPSTYPNGRVRETDHVVLVHGTVFVVEVKNYKGRLVWEDTSRGGLLQVKTGRYGEAIAPKKAKNPLVQARSYIYPVKQYLVRVSDRRFERLRMEPVAAFTRDGDITAIHSLEEGLVYVDELPAFFALQRNEQFADRPSGWIVNGLESLPRLDVVRTKGGHLFRGLLEAPRLDFRAPGRNQHHWEWREIEWIYLEPSGLFSSHDKLRIQLRSGQSVETSAVQGTVRMLDLEGQRTEHALSNLAFIAPLRVRLS